jgi:hypothetical protein
VGILSIKELLNHIDLSHGAADGPRPIRDLMLPAYQIPETMTLKTLLKEFRAKRQQMATVIDEFGGNAGSSHWKTSWRKIVGEFEDEYSPRAKSLRVASPRRSSADRSPHPDRRIHGSGRRADSTGRLHDAIRLHLSASRTDTGTERSHRAARVRADRRSTRWSAHRADQLHIDETCRQERNP